MTVEYKAFNAALALIGQDPIKAKKYVADKRLSLQEKIILNSFIALRDFQNAEVIESLSKFTCQSEYIEAQRLFCLGAAYNNQILYKEAELSLKSAIALYKDTDSSLQKIKTLECLFIVYVNLVDIGQMEAIFNLLKETHGKNYLAKPGLIYFEFTICFHKKEFAKAKQLAKKLEVLSDGLSEHQYINFYYDMFDIHVAEDNLNLASEVLKSIMNIKKYKNSSQVKFMNSVLSFVVKDVPLYFYEKDYVGSPEFLTYLKFLSALESGQIDEAKEAWVKLSDINKDYFCENFEYRGPKNLFALALRKFLNKNNTQSEILVKKITSNEDKLLSLLAGSKLPVRKEVIYQEIWGSPLESKEDLKKLFKVAQRARKKYNVEIKTIKGAYCLEKKAS